MKLFAAFILMIASVMQTNQNDDAIVGLWWTEGKKAKVEIYKNGDHFEGKVVWLEKNDRGDDHPLMGKKLIHGFRQQDARWIGGKVYDPENGKTYDSILKLQGKSLEVRGFIRMPMFGKSVFWQRVEEGK